MLHRIKELIPKPILDVVRPPYHLALAFLGSLIYGNPSKQLTVVAVTGTKGKSTTTELIATLFRAQGYTTASTSTIQFRIGDEVERNLYKMGTPGRFFLQRFMRRAVDAGCTHAVLELTSEGAKQFRHRFIHLDALVFTNLSPEHIESHGSFENYKNAKLSIAKQVAASSKRPRYIVANKDDEHSADFLAVGVDEKIPYGLDDLKLHTLHRDGIGLIFRDGNEEITIRIPLVGLFNVYNALAAITATQKFGVTLRTAESALRSLPPIKGRVEHFPSAKNAVKQFTAIVDYAHTIDSLEKFYAAFKDHPKVCILGNTGGGRDTWKRPEMAHIAERHCDHMILTDEDPYDEDPQAIVDQMAAGVEDKSKLSIIMDRRTAIREAMSRVADGGYVLISGKGTDPYIMRAHGAKEPWDDATVVQEEMAKMFPPVTGESETTQSQP